MMGFTWAKDPTDDMWHVPVLGEDAQSTYLCKKGQGMVEWTEMSECVYEIPQLSGKICEVCLLEEIVLEVAK